MRLIDADALKKLRHDYIQGRIKFNGSEYDLIDKCPTIDPESLRPQGEWVDKPTGAYGRWQSWCSHCGKHSGIGGIESNRHKPYCPNCGAKMKGAESDA